MGDYLLSRGLMISVDGKDYDFLGVTTNAVKRMSEGELLQIQKTRKLDIDEETYFKVILRQNRFTIRNLLFNWCNEHNR